jgi:L-threonylcarbamoyladenylate synthase
MPVMSVECRDPDPRTIDHASDILRSGGVVAFPTETVYGLGADAGNSAAVQRIFAIKGRPADNPLIAHVSDIDAAEQGVARVTPLARRLAQRWWPGPLTLVVPARPGGAGVAAGVTAGLDTVAVRAPSHPVARALLDRSGLALAAPSANRSGRPSPTCAAHVVDDLGDVVDLVIDGGCCAIGLESTVVDARGAVPVVLREGAVSREDLGVRVADDPVEERRSPGTHHRHYAPRCAVEIVEAAVLATRAQELAATGALVGAVLPRDTDPGPARTLAVFDTSADLGRRLFTALREAERTGCDVVLVSSVAERGVGRAVMDRLRRAAGHLD